MNPGDYGFGGLLTLELDSLHRAHRFMEHLQNESGFGLMAVSLGYFDTLMSASAASTSSELNTAELQKAGIGAGLVRLSVGLTGSLEQRWSQLKEAYTWIHSFDVESIQDVEMKLKNGNLEPATGTVTAMAVKGKGKLQQPSWPVIVASSAKRKHFKGTKASDAALTVISGDSGTGLDSDSGNNRGASVPASAFSEATDTEDIGDALLCDRKMVD